MQNNYSQIACFPYTSDIELQGLWQVGILIFTVYLMRVLSYISLKWQETHLGKIEPGVESPFGSLYS